MASSFSSGHVSNEMRRGRNVKKGLEGAEKEEMVERKERGERNGRRGRGREERRKEKKKSSQNCTGTFSRRAFLLIASVPRLSAAPAARLIYVRPCTLLCSAICCVINAKRQSLPSMRSGKAFQSLAAPLQASCP